MSFCSLIKGLPRKFAGCVFVLTNSVLLNLLCVWIRRTALSTLNATRYFAMVVHISGLLLQPHSFFLGGAWVGGGGGGSVKERGKG